MKLVKIDSSVTVFDTQLDQHSCMIEEQMGTRLAGGLFGILVGLALVMSIIGTIISYQNNSLIVSPLIPVAFAFVFLGWPFYWCINQFFIKRRYFIDRPLVHFELFTLLQRGKKVQVPLYEYGKIVFGHKGKMHALGNQRYSSPGYYYVCLPHKNKRLQVTLYQNVQQPLSEERLSRYSQMFNLPLENRSPNHVPAGHRIGELARDRKETGKGLQELAEDREKTGRL